MQTQTFTLSDVLQKKTVLKVKKTNIIHVKIEVKAEAKIQVEIQVEFELMCDCVHDRTCEQLILRVLTSREKRFWQRSFC